jgi:hypothetical protein
MKRMTARDAFDGEPAALEQAETINGFDRILGTGRLKTTGRRQPRRDKALIKTDWNQGEIFQNDVPNE